jgi:hypothetical protein
VPVFVGMKAQYGCHRADLMEAVQILKELNRAVGRKVPTGAPTSLVPVRYADYLAKARKRGAGSSGEISVGFG